MRQARKGLGSSNLPLSATTGKDSRWLSESDVASREVGDSKTGVRLWADEVGQEPLMSEAN